MKSSIQKSAKPLEGTPLRRRPTWADAVGWKQHRLTLSLLVVCFLDSVHRQSQAGQRPESQHSLQGAPKPSLHLSLRRPHSTGSSHARHGSNSDNRPFTESPHPNPSHSVPQLGCSLHLRSLPLFSPWWITYSLKTTHLTKLSLIKKQPQLIFCPLLFSRTQGYLTYLFYKSKSYCFSWEFP